MARKQSPSSTSPNLADNPALLRYLTNSLIVSTLTAVLTVLVSAYTAYSFSKFRYRGRRSLMYLVLASQMFPQALLLITLYLVFSRLRAAQLLPGADPVLHHVHAAAVRVDAQGLLRHHPRRAARGGQGRRCRAGSIIHRILLPVSLPGLVATGLFAFIRGWNDFIFALTLAGPDKQTLPPGLVNTYLGEFQTAWPDLMAASLVVSLPVVIGFIILQRYLVAGLTSGAVKG